MTETVETLLLLCRLLRPPGAPAISVPTEELVMHGDQWKAVIDQANAHYLTSALWLALERKGQVHLLPGDAREFLAEARRLNRARNERIREQAAELIRALNRAGVIPLVLKGGVYLFEGDEGAFDTRMMVDLDLLIPGDQFEASVSVTERLGYEVIAEHADWAHDYHRLGRQGDLAAIELHRDVGAQRTLLPVEEAFRQAVPLDAEGLSALALSPTDRVLHNIFHAAIQDQYHGLGRVPVRQLHDLTLITERHGDEVDWNAVRSAMDRQGYKHVLRSYLYLANCLLGLTQPAGIPQTFRAKLHYQRCLAQVRRRWLSSLANGFGVLTRLFGRSPIDYIYGAAPNFLVLNANRFRRACEFARMHRSRAWSRLTRLYRMIDAQSD